MIYFDNGATGSFKPRAVIDSAETVIKFLSANPGRSGHRLSLSGAEIVFDTRTTFSKYFSVNPERVIFTKNCTEALNMAIFGSLKVNGHIITTIYEHNSVLRPLFYLKERGLITLDIVSPDKEKNIVEKIKEKINPKTYLIIATAISNVNGEMLPIKEIGSLARQNNLLFLVDGAQGGGHINLNLEDNNISILALAGHKGLYGIMGSGVLMFTEKVEIEPLLFGGTGTESFNTSMPNTYPEKLEAGTLNLPAIASLNEGTNYALKNLSNFSENLCFMTEKIIKSLSLFPLIKCYSLPNPAGIVAFSITNKQSTEVADILNTEYDIAVRSGLHCAPLMHEFLGTKEDGLIRVSLAVQNTSNEINYFLRSIEKIINA